MTGKRTKYNNRNRRMKYESPFSVLLHPYVTEKTMSQMENENKIEFIVDRRATKDDVKKAFLEMFEAKAVDVNVKIKRTGKHAIIRVEPEISAEEIGMRVGVF